MDASAWDERYRDADLVWGFEPNRFVREQCHGLVPVDAIDLACGEGRNALWLARLGWQVSGIDYSGVAIQRAIALTTREPPDVRARLNWSVGDVTQTPPQPDSVDLALISYVHLPPGPLRTLIAGAVDALRPGGHLVMVGHDLLNLSGGVSGPQDPDLLYVPARLRQLIEHSSLMTVEHAITARRPTDDGVALDTVVRAHRDYRGDGRG